MQEIKKNVTKVINDLSEFKKEKKVYLLPYQLKDKNWVLLLGSPDPNFHILTVFKDVENIEQEIKPIFDNQLSQGYNWRGTISIKLLERKSETVEESFVWSLACVWGWYEYWGPESEWKNWSNIVKNTQKYLIDETRKQYWDLLPEEFKQGGKKQLEELNKQKSQLEKEKTILDNQIKSLETEKTNLNNQLTSKDNEIKKLNDDKTNLTTDKNNLETQLKSEIKELETKNTQLAEKLLKIEREEVKQELTSFYQKVDIDDDLIEEKFKNSEEWKKKYGEKFDYEDVVDKWLTLENRKDVIGAFKIVACICATEEVKRLNETYKNTVPKPARFLKKIEKVDKGWKETEQYPQINKENNPFYLNIIEEKKQECKNEIVNLMKENQLQSLQLQSNK